MYAFDFRRNLKLYLWALIVAWTLLTAGFLVWHVAQARHHSFGAARLTLERDYQRELGYRRWALQHSGVYVEAPAEAPASPASRPNPTAAGRPLIPVNPCQMAREAAAAGEAPRLVSLTAAAPAHQPDPWEAEGLRALAAGAPEVSGMVEIAGQEGLRLLRPLWVEASCLGCHAGQGFRLGEMRGGISLGVSLAPFRALVQRELLHYGITHLLLWLIGLGLLLAGGLRLRRLQEFQQAVLDNLPNSVAAVDGKGVIRAANQGWRDLMREVVAPLDDGIGRPYLETLGQIIGAGDQAARQRQEVADWIAGQGDRCYLEFLCHRRTPAKWFGLRGRRFRFHGQPWLVLTHADISPRKEVEARLAEQQQLLRDTIDAAPLWIAQIDKDLRYRIANRHHETLGAPLAQWEGRPMRELLPAVIYERHLAIYQRVLAGERLEFDEEFPLPQGPLHTHGLYAPLYDDAGEVKAFTAVIMDITAQRLAEQRQREMEGRLKALGDNLRDGILFWGVREADGRIRFEYFSKGLETMLGLSTAAAVLDSQSVFAGIHPEDRPGFFASLERAAADLSPLELEYRHLTPAGEKWIYSRATPQAGADGRIFFSGVSLDVTRRKHTELAILQAREAAESANRAKSAFLASMSHEIRTPMNAILGFSDLLYQQAREPRERNYLEAIRSSGKNLLALINDILDLSKIEAGRLNIQPEPLDLMALLREVEMIFSLRIQEKGLAFFVEIAPQLPPTLMLDEVRVRQLLVNLVGNAVKFTDRGSIAITAGPLGEPRDGRIDLRLAVEDTGRGIPPEAQQLVFEAFRQQDQRDSRNHGGVGLGLTICKRLAEMMNGDILLHSTPGQGSRFEVRLRGVEVAAGALAPRPTPEIRPLAMTFEPATLLVVDDVGSNRDLVAAYLADTPLKVLSAENGQQALVMAQVRPDLILMDLRMPEMDGYEATRRIKEQPELRPIPIIALTASVLADTHAKVLQRGFAGFLRKPVQQMELYRELMRFLPCRQQEPAAAGSALKQQRVVLQGADPQRLASLLAELEDQMKERWEGVRSSMAFEEIAAFAERLAEIGEAYGAPLLREYGQALAEQAQGFQIADIERSLQEYPALIERLRTWLPPDGTAGGSP